MENIIIGLTSGLIGSIIGGFFALRAVTLIEYYRSSSILKCALRNSLKQLEKSEGHPASVVENTETDSLVADVTSVMSCFKKSSFNAQWEEYRYDKSHPGHIPTEYTKDTINSKTLISKRIKRVIDAL